MGNKQRVYWSTDVSPAMSSTVDTIPNPVLKCKKKMLSELYLLSQIQNGNIIFVEPIVMET